MLCFVLEQNGFQAIEAEDYPSAVNLLAEPYPDLVLLDWMLPGGFGIQFIKQMKREALSREIPVVMLTARGASPNPDAAAIAAIHCTLAHRR
ncbi:MAG: response regulator [Sodalis sp. (in: enterobacteria)]|uniref:response regulator n=1 Tax=Sodalis sp. (in: enterobacteria) TaxID=1898979 RepID=UPI0039E37D0B